MIACVIITQSLSSHGLICISHSISSLCTSTLGVKYPFHYLTMWWRWGRGSFASFTMLLPVPGMEVGEKLIYIIRVSPSTLGGGGGGAHLNSQCHPLYVGWRWGRGSFTSSPECLPLRWVEVGVGLIYIIHRVSPSTLG